MVELPDSALTFVYDTMGLQWGHVIFGSYYTWNADNNITSRIDRNSDGFQWRDSVKELYTYDAYRHLRSDLTLRYSGNSWDTVQLQTYTYDGYGELKSKQDYSSYTSWGTFMQAYTYHGDPARPLSKLYMVRQPGQGVWDTLQCFFYSNTIPVDTQLTQGWDTIHHVWANSSLIIDSAEQNVYIYDFGGATGWNMNVQMFKTYDSYGHQTSLRVLDYQLGAWTQTTNYRYLYSLDTAGRILSEEEQYYDNTWRRGSVYTCVYDSIGRILTSRFDAGSWMQDSLYGYDSMGYVDYSTNKLIQPGRPVTGDSTKYFYHRAISTGISESVLAADIAVYPIPAHDQLIVALHSVALENITLTLTDMSGRKVMSAIVADGTSHLDVSGLSAGVYTLSLIDGRGAGQVRRVVIR